MNKKLPPIYLASQSPRRKDLLQGIGLLFTVYVPKEPELAAPTKRGKATPATIVKKIAAAKGKNAAAELAHKGVLDAVILSADTLVFLGNEVLGKPKDEADAKRILKKLSRRTHRVATAVQLLLVEKGQIKKVAAKVIQTKVTFHALSAKDLDWYIKTKEPLDKAGAYGAQLFGAAFIKSFSGSYTNVVGLPVAETVQLLSALTKRPWQDWTKA
jgi:septum formation protein